MDDRFLARQVVAGHPDAFRLLVLRHQRPLFRFLGFLGLTGAAAEDIAQETFLRAFRTLDRFDPERGELSTWLLTIAKRLAINDRARAANRHEVPVGQVHVHVEEQPDDAANVAELALARERDQRVRQAVGALPEPLRSTFALAQLEELDLEQVAAVEGCAVGTVKSRVFRARERLRLILNDEEKHR